MQHRFYSLQNIGRCYLMKGMRRIASTFEIGVVQTGRAKVVVGFFVKVKMPDGTKEVGEDPHNLRAALYALQAKIQNDNFILLCSGLDKYWSESGLSANTGYGYYENGDGPVHIMSLPPREDSKDRDTKRIWRDNIFHHVHDSNYPSPKSFEPGTEEWLDRIVKEAVSTIGSSTASHSGNPKQDEI